MSIKSIKFNLGLYKVNDSVFFKEFLINFIKSNTDYTHCWYMSPGGKEYVFSIIDSQTPIWIESELDTIGLDSVINDGMIKFFKVDSNKKNYELTCTGLVPEEDYNQIIFGFDFIEKLKFVKDDLENKESVIYKFLIQL